MSHEKTQTHQLEGVILIKHQIDNTITLGRR